MTEQLQRRLSSRHITFMALGMAIGSGLFYGSADAIQKAGPAIIFSYLLCGLVIYLVMRALGELAVDDPVAGSFSTYARRYIGPLAGYITGWNYWLLMAFVGIVESTAVAKYMAIWFPDVPQWWWVAGSVIMIGALNMVTVKVFGELEFWFSLIKVLTVVLMLIGGGAMIIWGIGNAGQPIGISHLWQHGGWFPKGWEGVLLAMPVVIFSFGGVETIGMAAAESADPSRNIPRAVNSLLWRILLFYVGSLFVIMALYPWTEIGTHGSPFVTTFERLGISKAAGLLNFVLITAALSAFNSTTFSGSRILHSLAISGQAPVVFGKLSAHSVPVRGVLITMVMLVLGVAMNYLWPDRVFGMMIAILNFNVIWTWCMVLIAHFRFRQQRGAGAYALGLWPWTSLLCLVFFAGILVSFLFHADGRVALYAGAAWVLLLCITYKLLRVKHLSQAMIHEQNGAAIGIAP